jgi:hypothetical protein
MSGFVAVNEAFRLARKQNDTLREALKSTRETLSLASRASSQATPTKKRSEATIGEPARKA